MSRSCLCTGLITGLIVVSASTALAQTSATWKRTTNNEKWTVDNNWTGQAFAQGVDQSANFSTLDLTADTTVDLDGNITIGSLAFGDITPSNNWTVSGAGVLTLDVTAGTPTITVNNQTTTIAVVLSGNDGFTKAGAGTLLLTGANNYTGGTTISNGILSVSSLANGGVNSNIGSSSSAASNLVLNSGTLLYTGTGSTSDRQFTLGASGGTVNASGTGALVLTSTTGPTFTGTNTARTLTLTGNSAAAINNSMAASIGDNGTGATSLTKSGSGTWVLSGNSTYSGQTTVDAGVLTIQSANALGSTVGGTSVTGGAALQIQGGITTAAESLTLNGSGVSNGGALRNVSGNNTYSGAISLGAASTIRSDSGTLTIDVASGNAISALNQNVTFSGNGNITVADSISLGNGSLTKSGGGTLTLSAANSFSGGTTWGSSNAAGIISIGNNAALGTGTFTASNSGTVGGNNWIQSSDGTARTMSNNIVVSGSGINFNTSGSGDLTFSGNVALGGTGTRNFNIVNSRTEFSGILSGGASLGKDSAGTLVLSGANTYTGATSISGGTLQLGNGGTSGMLATSSAITVNSGAIFSVNQSDTVTQGTDFSGGVISGAGGFTQAGSGTTILTANNTYTGATNVNAGTLQINGDQSGATGAVTVSNGATLGGSGTIGGATTISGIHSPGNSPGLQTFNGGLTYLDGSSLTWELADNTVGGRGTMFDGIDVTGGTLTINSGVTSNLVFNASGSLVDWSNSFWAISRQWLVYDNANAPVLGTPIFTTINVSNDKDGDSLASARVGSFFSWSQVGDDVFLKYTFAAAAVPEPGTFGLMCIAGLAGVIRYRRRRKEMPEV